MIKSKLIRLFTLILSVVIAGCNYNANDTTKLPEFSFSKIKNLNGTVFDSGSNVQVTASVVDKYNNVFVLTHFVGALQGVASENRDIAILKFNSSGTLLWKFHLNSSTTGISDASLDESSNTLIWNEADKALYFTATTKSPLIEPNVSAQADLIVGKIKSDSTISWIRHFGTDTQDDLKVSLSNPAIDLSLAESPGPIIQTATGELVVTFDTMGSFFEAQAGLGDLAIMKLDNSTGDIISGKQVGSVTLAAYGVSESIAVDGTKKENVLTSNIAFDGTKIVIPFRTMGSFVETNAAPGTNDAGYIVFNDDLSINKIKQLGNASYAAWTAAGNYAGSTSADNQFRGVVVNAPGDYLFYGKTNGNLAELSAGGVDFIFARYQNHNLVKLIQYGATTKPSGTTSEEPRAIVKDSKGNIYCSGHTRSSLFETVAGTLNPVVMRVTADGDFVSGVQLGSVTSAALGLTDIKYTQIADNDLIVKDGQVLVGFYNDPVTTTTYTPYLWSFKAP